MNTPVIAFDEIDNRLKSLGLDRSWLATSSGRTPDSIRSALAPNAAPSKRSPLIQRALSDAIEKEEIRRASEQERTDKLPPGYSQIFLSDEEIDTADKASRLVEAPSLAAFCHDVIQGEARRIIAEHAEKLRVVESEEVISFPIRKPGAAAAGNPSAGHVEDAEIPVGKQYPADHYAVSILGRSMEPKIPEGSTIIVKEYRDKGFPKKGAIVIYSDANGSTLKEFGYRKAQPGEDADTFGNVPVLRSLNREFPDVQTMEGGRIDAVLVEVLTK